MRFWKRKTRQPQVDDVFRKIEAASFPGGEQQIDVEAAQVVSRLDGGLSHGDARDILVFAKARVLIALQSAPLQSAKDSEEVLRRCIESVRVRSQGQLSRTMAEKVATFAFQRLIEQRREEVSANSSGAWEGMTKEEALKVSRITAYRLARHQGRNDPNSREIYQTDPETYIIQAMGHFLIDNKAGRPKRIETQRDALELSRKLAVMLVMRYYMEKHGTDSMPDPQTADRLAQEELELTLALVRDHEEPRQYRDYDPLESGAARQMHVPFDIALTLGEIGLLKDSSGPIDVRREMMRRLEREIASRRRSE